MLINKKANFDYNILERLECGIVLEGWELKSILDKKVSIGNSFITIKDEELFWLNANFSPNPKADRFSIKNPERNRKLLAKKSEIQRLVGKIEQKGYTLIPLKLYTKGKKYKLEIGLAKGKKEYDKRETIKTRESNIEISRTIKQKLK